MHSNFFNANYFLADGARMNDLISKFTKFNAYPISLYIGTEDELLADVGPFVVNIASNTNVINWLLDEGRGLSWGVFLKSSFELEELVEHLQTLTSVTDEEGNEFYFRFYDPRVIRKFLPTCDTNQLNQFFSNGISYFLAEKDSDNIFIKYYLSNAQLVEEEFDILSYVDEKNYHSSDVPLNDFKEDSDDINSIDQIV